jgi:hypothetical protein
MIESMIKEYNNDSLGGNYPFIEPVNAPLIT